MLNIREAIIVIILGIVLTTSVLYTILRPPTIIINTEKIDINDTTDKLMDKMEEIESHQYTIVDDIKDSNKESNVEIITSLQRISDRLSKLESTQKVKIIQVMKQANKKVEEKSKPVAIPSYSNYKEFIVDTIINSQISSLKVFMTKLYKIEANNNPNAVEPRNKSNFGLCQLNDYWGNRLANEVNAVWNRELTDEPLQKLMCELRVEIIHTSYDKVNPYKQYIDDITDIIIYLAHQVGIEGSKQIGRFIIGVDDTIETKNIDSLVNNLDKRDRDKFISIINTDGYTKVDKWYLLYLWFDKFNNVLENS